MFCKDCGAQIRENAKFCPNCGSEVRMPSIPNMAASVAQTAPAQQMYGGSNVTYQAPAASAASESAQPVTETSAVVATNVPATSDAHYTNGNPATFEEMERRFQSRIREENNRKFLLDKTSEAIEEVTARKEDLIHQRNVAVVLSAIAGCIPMGMMSADNLGIAMLMWATFAFCTFGACGVRNWGKDHSYFIIGAWWFFVIAIMIYMMVGMFAAIPYALYLNRGIRECDAKLPELQAQLDGLMQA